MKKKTNVHYDSVADAMWIRTHEGMEIDSEELAPGITVEFDKNRSVIGFEILRASEVLSSFLDQRKAIASGSLHA
ncbi:DUF2283 domain-containing protein [Candidatus Gottesmanbacteria bacterium]|nr:DUF2283 domain-containing protein [Candidatus Gottesmanbacteria bacterium]